MKRLTNTALIIIILTSLITGCSQNQLGRSRMLLLQQQKVDSIGKKMFVDFKKDKNIENNKAVNDYVNLVLSKLIAQKNKTENKAWEVAIYQSKIIEITSLESNYIALSTGLLNACDSTSEVAFVLASEVARIQLRHMTERLQRAIVNGTTDSETTTKEKALSAALRNNNMKKLHTREAYLLGQTIMAEAGFDPSVSVPFLKRLYNRIVVNNTEWTQKIFNDMHLNLKKTTPIYNAVNPKPLINHIKVEISND